MSRVLKICLPVVLMAAFVTSPVQAEQSGRWRGKAVLVTTSSTEAKVGDTADHVLEVGVQDGMVFTEEGGDFLANARYQVAYLYDSAGMINGGYKTFTADDDSKVFAQFSVRESKWPILKGDWKFLNGTGKF